MSVFVLHFYGILFPINSVWSGGQRGKEKGEAGDGEGERQRGLKWRKSLRSFECVCKSFKYQLTNLSCKLLDGTGVGLHFKTRASLPEVTRGAEGRTAGVGASVLELRGLKDSERQFHPWLDF